MLQAPPGFSAEYERSQPLMQAPRGMVAEFDTQQQSQQQQQAYSNGASGRNGYQTDYAADSSASSAYAATAPSSSPPPSSSRGRRKWSDRCLDAGELCLDGFVKLIGPILSVLCIFLIGLITRAYFIDVLPLLSARICHGASEQQLARYSTHPFTASPEPVQRDGLWGMIDTRSGNFVPADPTNPNSLEQMTAHYRELARWSHVDTSPCFATYSITAFGVYLLLSILFHYFATMLLGPGRPPAQLSEEVQQHLMQHDPDRRDDQVIRRCKPCKAVKPMRAHHCRVCNRCSLKMDHHCPWVNTCVGWRNHRHFLSFLVFLWAGTAFFLISSFDSAISVLLGGGAMGDASYLVATIVSFAAHLAGSLFLAWCGYLLLTNQTTIEFYGNQWGHKPGNPYAPVKGGWSARLKNIKSVFGEQWMRTLLLPSLAPPPGDGIIFPLNDGRGLPLPMLIHERAA